MVGINPDEVEFVLSKISDGFVFEKYAQEFISVVVGHTFVPVGGIHDRGIDGLEHTFSQEGRLSTIYQLSIEKDTKSKIENTIRILNKNQIEIDRFTYVTNQLVKDLPKLLDEIYEDLGVNVQIHDMRWLRYHVNESVESTGVFARFKSAYFVEYEQPGKAYEIFDVVGDPRVTLPENSTSDRWKIPVN